MVILYLQSLIEELNFERELLFNLFNSVIIIWADDLFVKSVKKEALDLWSWISYDFELITPDDKIIKKEMKNIPLIEKPGVSEERKLRIQDLENSYKSLMLKDSDKTRVIKDKINILKSLGREYLELNNFRESVDNLSIAVSLSDKLSLNGIIG